MDNRQMLETLVGIVTLSTNMASYAQAVSLIIADSIAAGNTGLTTEEQAKARQLLSDALEKNKKTIQEAEFLINEDKEQTPG